MWCTQCFAEITCSARWVAEHLAEHLGADIAEHLAEHEMC